MNEELDLHFREYDKLATASVMTIGTSTPPSDPSMPNFMNT